MNRSLHRSIAHAALLSSLLVVASTAEMWAQSMTPDTIRVNIGESAVTTFNPKPGCEATVTLLPGSWSSAASITPSSGIGGPVPFTVTGVASAGITAAQFQYANFDAPGCATAPQILTVPIIVCDKPAIPQVVYLNGASTGTIVVQSFACDFRVRAHRASGTTDNWSLAPSGSQILSEGSSVTFNVTVDRAKSGEYFVAKISWVSADGKRSGAEFVLVRLGSPETPAEKPSTTAGTPGAGQDGDPINTATGELYIPSRVDLAFGGPMPLEFSRYYASMMNFDGSVSEEIGLNWRHNFQWRSFRRGTELYVVTDHGRIIQFHHAGNGVWSLVGSLETPYQLSGLSTYRFLDPRTQRVYTFGSTGRLVSVADRTGNRHSLHYAAEGWLAAVTDSLGRTLTLTRDTLGHITRVSDGTRTLQFEYSGDLLTRFVDARGNATSYGYDVANKLAGLLTSTTYPEGNTPITQKYDADARVVEQTMAPGYRTTLDYNGSTTTVTDPLGNAISHEHDASRQLVAHTDQLGNRFALAANASGQRERIIDRLGDSTMFSYHAASGRISQHRAADGSTTRYAYTSRTTNGLTFHDIASISHADGSTTSYLYDTLGNAIEVTDRAGGKWRYSYNARGQRLTATNPSGGVTTWTYNADGTTASVRDNAGNTTTYTYDALRRPTRVTRADATSVSYEYDANDNVRKVIDGRGNVWSYSYDKNDRLVSSTDPLAKLWRYEYDALDRLVRTIDPLGNASERGYDSLGRLSTMRDASGRTIALAYDAAGRIISVRDGAGGLWGRSTDKEGVTTGGSDPMGNEFSFESDRMGRTTSATSPLGARVLFDYDAMGRLDEIVDPSGERRSFAYDARGSRTSARFPESIEASYAWDSLGGLTAVTDPNGRLWRRSHDAMGRTTSATDPLGNVTSYTYDNHNRLRQTTLPGGLGTSQITRDAVGAITRRQYSDGTDLTMTYDDAGRLVSTNGATIGYDDAGRITASPGGGVERDGAGRITRLTLAAGKQIDYSYDARGLVTEVRDWIGGATTLAYDSARRMTSITYPNAIVTEYRYDADGRLVAITHGTHASIDLTRSARGEIVSANRSGVLRPLVPTKNSSHTFDASSQASGAGNSYDAMGRMTSSGDMAFTWDLASRLKSYTASGNSVSFAYDGFGNVISRTDDAGTTTYRWNLALGLHSISIVQVGGTDRTYHVHLPNGALLYRVNASNDSRSFHHYDEIGSTILLSDEDGGITDRYAYTPYGADVRHEGTSDNPFTYGGLWGVMAEEGTSLYQMRARWYDASRGRFISRDPLRSLHPMKLNLYRYALGNPMRHGDPTGADEVPVATPNEEMDPWYIQMVKDILDPSKWEELGTEWPFPKPVPTPVSPEPAEGESFLDQLPRWVGVTESGPIFAEDGKTEAEVREEEERKARDAGDQRDPVPPCPPRPPVPESCPDTAPGLPCDSPRPSLPESCPDTEPESQREAPNAKDPRNE